MGTPETPGTPGTMRIVGVGDVAEAVRGGHIAITPVQQLARQPTGFPSPAEDMAEAPLSLDDLLVRRPASTFFVEMAGDALRDAGIFAGDVLVVDRSLTATSGAAVVVALDGELMARLYCPDSEAIHLLPAHPDVAPITITARDRSHYQLWGVVTGVVRRLHRHTRHTRHS
jgi:DNA polymerase V